MSEKWWKATPYSLQELEIVKHSEQSVFMGTSNRREAIDSSYHHWRQNKNNAIAAVVVDLQTKIDEHDRNIKYLKEQIAKLELNFDK